MLHALSLGGILALLWLLLSGYFTPLLLSLGVASVVGVVAIAHRMDAVDHDQHPLALTWRAALYWPWLIVEIVKANIDIAKVILAPRLKISPSLMALQCGQTGAVGRVSYANSITLTPGTVTVDMDDGGELLVHALTKGAADGLATGEMDRRVTAMEHQPAASAGAGTQAADGEPRR